MPLKDLKLTPYTAKELKPSGWLRRQLQIQAAGLSGHLDEIWPDVRDSRWIGGNRDGWERFPYWLDGFIPLAYLLDDDELKVRAERYVDRILEAQCDDGWICPCAEQDRWNYDVWVVFLICKVLALYCDCTGNAEKGRRAQNALSRALKNLSRQLERKTLFDWGSARWFEALVPIFWLYDRTQEQWLIELAEKLQVQGMDYRKLFEHFRLDQPQEKGRWNFMTHVVNHAMALKAIPLADRMEEGNTDANVFAKRQLWLLQHFHGMPTGHFTGDECLSGNSAIQGSELCSVVEAMFSYEQLLSLTGDAFWGDILESVAFNAFPAALSADMWTHQYDQQTNQVQCSILPQEHIIFRTNGADANLFGLEPHFGCCTANFHQGWPKLALSAFMQTSRGIASTVLVPSKLQTRVGRAEVTVTLDTLYPFRDTLTFRVFASSPVAFDLDIRIPGFADSAQVDGVRACPGAFFTVSRVWEGEQTAEVQLSCSPCFLPRPNDLVCVRRGVLVYALPIDGETVMHEYVRDGVERKFPYCDYEIFPRSAWNYAYVSDALQYEEHPLQDFPFGPDAPVSLTAQVTEIDWPMEYGVCTAVPAGRIPRSAPRTIRLIPYGCTQLRMTEMPLLSVT